MRAMKSSVAEFRRVATVAIGCASLMAGVADSVVAGDLVVRYDQSQLIRLPRPVTEVIIGNPSIADVTVQGGNLLVVTGKTFGVTNVIALDAQRNVIQDQRVVVEQDPQHTVVLYKGSLRHSLTCSPTCTPAIVIGDDPAYFDVIAKSAQTKTGTSAPDRGTVNQE